MADYAKIAEKMRAAGKDDQFIAAAFTKRGIDPTPYIGAVTAPVQQAEAAPAEEPKSFGGFMGNILPSAGALVKNTWGAVTSPVKTVNSLYDVAVGGTLGTLAGSTGDNPFLPTNEKGKAVIDMLKQRYGGVKNIGNTAYEDPFGVASDVSALFGGVGGVAGAASKVGKIAKLTKTAEAAGKVAKVANAVEKFTNPASLVTRAPIALIKKLPISRSVGDLRNPVSLAEKVQEEIPQLVKRAGSEYATKVDALNDAGIAAGKKVQMGDIVSKTLGDGNEAMFAEAMKYPKLKKVIDSWTTNKPITSLTLKEANEIKKALNAKLLNKGMGKATFKDWQAINLRNELYAAIGENYPEMKPINTAFREARRTFKDLAPAMNRSKTIDYLKNSMGNVQIQGLVNQNFPRDLAVRMGKYGRSTKGLLGKIFKEQSQLGVFKDARLSPQNIASNTAKLNLALDEIDRYANGNGEGQ